MPLRRGFSQRGPQASRLRRKTAWTAGPGGTTPTAVSASSAVLVGSGLVPVQEALTVVRIRGELLCFMSLVTSANDGFSGAFGIGIAELPAFTAGIASLQTPITDVGAENWLYWTAVQCFDSTASLAAGNAGSMVFRTTVDTKAMRKISTNQVLYAAIELVEVGGATLQIHFDSRALFKLP